MSRLPVVVASTLSVLALVGCGASDVNDPLGNRPPVAEFTYQQGNTANPLGVTFDASRSHDPDGSVSRYVWDFGDGLTASAATPLQSYLYAARDTYVVTLTVSDNLGATATRTRVVNTAHPVGSVKWSFAFPGDTDAVDRMPAVGADGIIYVSAAQRFGNWRLYAVNSDGTPKWVFDQFAGGVSSPISDPVVSRGTDTVYVGYLDGRIGRARIVAISPAGELKWTYDIPHQVTSLPGWLTLSYARNVPVDSVYFTTPASSGTDIRPRIYKINSYGEAQWAVQGDSEFAGLALGGSGELYAANADGIRAYAPDGTVAWSYLYSRGTPTGSIAVGDGGTIYVGYANPGHMLALGRTTTGAWTIRWEYAVSGDVGTPAIGADGIVYCATSPSGVRALDPGDASQRWVFNAPTGPYPITLLDDGTVLARVDYALSALDWDGQESWRLARAPGFGAAAVADDGTIYVVGVPPEVSGGTAHSRHTHLYAVQGPAHLANTSWPHPRHDNCNTGWFNGP